MATHRMTVEPPQTEEWPTRDDKWEWVAFYDDGTHLAEYEPDNSVPWGFYHNKFDQIDQDRLFKLALMPVDVDGGLKPFVLDFRRGMKPILYRIRQREISPNQVTGSYDERDPGVRVVGVAKIQVIGYEQTVKGKTVKHLVYIMEDGGCVISNHPKAMG